MPGLSEQEELLTISGTEDEVLLAATEHAVSSHGHMVGPELRENLKKAMKDESEQPPTDAKAPVSARAA